MLALLPARSLSRQQHLRVEIRLNTQFSMTGSTHPRPVEFEERARNTHGIVAKTISGTRRCSCPLSNASVGGYPKRILVTCAPKRDHEPQI